MLLQMKAELNHPHNNFFINKTIINRKEYFMAETTDLLGFAVEKSPVDFADTLNQLLGQKAQERIEAHRVTLAQSIYSDNESDDVEDTDDDVDFDDADDEFDFTDDELEDLDDDDDDLDLEFLEKFDGILGTAITFRLTFLTTETSNFGDGHPNNARVN
jgi:hypothetical protein